MCFSHKEWRKIAKRERRRRIRTKQAVIRDNVNNEEYLREQEILQTLELEIIERTNAEENEKWLRAECIASMRWHMLQENKRVLHQERLEKEAKLRLEWEMAHNKKMSEEKRMKAIEEENRLHQENVMQGLEEFLAGDSNVPPRELLNSRETRPNAPICPFFARTSSCRFGDMCSRNHQHPGISKLLLATNFFVHFGMDNTTPTEYDTDIMLEYEEMETYKQFKEFFYDILAEFEKFGKILMLKVCNNFEKHLRGNVYLEYDTLRSAVAAYRALNTRWYGGRQLSLQFSHISSWKNAICGLQFTKCPKGRVCNYLHVFRNPNKLFSRYDSRDWDYKRSPSRSWRWSESPEPDIPRSKDKNEDKEERRHRNDDRCHDKRKYDGEDKTYSDERKHRHPSRSKKN